MSDDADGRTPEPQQPEKFPIGLIVAGALAIVLVITIFSNDHRTPVKFLGFSTAIQLWLIIFISGLVGAAIGWMVTTFRRRARRNRRND
jgi:uncharacterized integral membrane protein